MIRNDECAGFKIRVFGKWVTRGEVDVERIQCVNVEVNLRRGRIVLP